MLFFIQYTFLDTREIEKNSRKSKLTIPTWPAPIPREEFIQSYGVVKNRKNGGVAGWIGEGSICDADKSIKIVPPYTKIEGAKISCVAKHIYDDGLFLTKVVLIFSLNFNMSTLEKVKIREFFFDEIVHRLMEIKLKIKSRGVFYEETVFSSAPKIAESYLHATMRNKKKYETNHLSPCGKPEIFIVNNGKKLEKQEKEESHSIKNYSILYKGHYISTWYLYFSKEHDLKFTRETRIRLMRYASELILFIYAIKYINKLKNKHPVFIKKSKENETFQLYLNRATKRILKHQTEFDKITSSRYADRLSYDSLVSTHPGKIEELKTSIENMQIRRQVKQKAIDVFRLIFSPNFSFVNINFFKGELNMAPKYNFENSTFNGSVGDESITINSQDDREQLLNEIAILKEFLGEKGSSLDDLVQATQDNEPKKIYTAFYKALSKIKQPAEKLGLTALTEIIKNMLKE